MAKVCTLYLVIFLIITDINIFACIIIKCTYNDCILIIETIVMVTKFHNRPALILAFFYIKLCNLYTIEGNLKKIVMTLVTI